MEILTAYVRLHFPWRESEQPGQTKSFGQVNSETCPRSDLQAVLAVLGRRRRTYGKGEDNRLDLRLTDLLGVWLSKARLEGASFFGAHLEKAVLLGAHLERASLMDTHLEKADLNYAHLEGARLEDAHLEGAWLIGAHLEKAVLLGAHLRGAWLMDAHLWGAGLRGADLEEAKLGGAHLEGVDLSDTLGLSIEQIRSAITDARTKLPPVLENALSNSGCSPSHVSSSASETPATGDYSPPPPQ